MLLQIPLRTQSSVETYVANHEWRRVTLLVCPLHPFGGCSFARHGSYGRVTPRGVRVARWYCPEGHRTFSLLPDFLAARFPGLLAGIESAVAQAQIVRSKEAAAELLRGVTVTLPSAIRWLRRRVKIMEAMRKAVGEVMSASGTAMPIQSTGDPPAIQVDSLLIRLRRSLSPRLLQRFPSPLGFSSASRIRGRQRGDQQEMGADGAVVEGYAAIPSIRSPPHAP